MSGGAALIGVSKYERSVGGYSGGGKRLAAARMPADPVRALAPTLNRNDRLESVIFFPLALGPHPQRELTVTPRRGEVWPQALFPLAAGPHPRHELTPTPSRGVPGRGSVWPQALFHWRRGPTPAANCRRRRGCPVHH